MPRRDAKFEKCSRVRTLHTSSRRGGEPITNMRTEQNYFNFRSNPILKLLLISGLALLSLAGSLQFSTAVFADETMHMEEFDVVGQPLNLVVESPNQVWFTLPAENAIGSLVVTNTVDYEFT